MQKCSSQYIDASVDIYLRAQKDIAYLAIGGAVWLCLSKKAYEMHRTLRYPTHILATVVPTYKNPFGYSELQALFR